VRNIAIKIIAKVFLIL